MFNFAIINYYNLNCNINWGAIFRKYFKTDKKISEAGQISKVCDGITKKYIYIVDRKTDYFWKVDKNHSYTNSKHRNMFLI